MTEHNPAKSFFSTDTLEKSANRRKIREIELTDLVEFKNHPFKVIEDDSMRDLVESIKLNGVLKPGTVRKIDDDKYEIVEGHRRKRACELAGLTTMPFEIKKLTDDEATLLMVDTNIYRDKILPSEKAYAYKMRLEVIRNGACKRDSKGRTDNILAAETPDSARTIQRYIRLTELEPTLLELVDIGKLPTTTAVEISYLDSYVQNIIIMAYEEIKKLPSQKDAAYLRNIESDDIDLDFMIELIKPKKTKGKKKAELPREINMYFSKSDDEEYKLDIILKLLEKWAAKEKNPDYESYKDGQ